MATEILESIPKPEAIRERLSSCVREAAVLRRLLKIAERAHCRKAERNSLPDRAAVSETRPVEK